MDDGITVFFELSAKVVHAVEASFFAHPTVGLHAYCLAVDVGIEAEDVRLKAYVVAAEGGIVAYVEQRLMPFAAFDADAGRVKTHTWDELTRLGWLDIGSGEAYLPTLLKALHHASFDGKGMAKA